MNKKIMAGIFSFLLTANVFAGCGEKDNMEEMPVVTSAVSTSGNMDDYFSVYAETEPVTDNDTEVVESNIIVEEGETETVVTSLADADEEDENAKEIRTMLDELFAINSSANADDYEAIYDYVDLDVFYYIAKGEKGDKETILNFLKEQGQSVDVNSFTMTSSSANGSNTIVKIVPLSEESNELYRKILEAESAEELAFCIAEQIGASDIEGATEASVNDKSVAEKYVPFSEVKEQFDITDVYCVTVHVSSVEEESSEVRENTYDDLDGAFEAIADDILSDSEQNEEAPELDTSALNFDMDMTFYVFKVNGEWKMDLPYSTEAIIVSLFSGFGQYFDAEYDFDNDTDIVSE